MWEKVLDAGIENALGVVRLGSSLELGSFLGSDLLKGRVSYRVCFWFRGGFDYFFRAVGPGRDNKTFTTLRDDVHDFTDACRKELDAGKDLYNVMMEYGAKRQARRAVSHGVSCTPYPVGY